MRKAHNSKLKIQNSKLLKLNLNNQLANLSLANHRCVWVFGPHDEELARMHLHVSGSRLGIESAVGFGIVGLCLVRAVLNSFPADGLLTFEEDVDVNILTVHLKHLLVGCYALGVDVVDEEVVALQLYASARSIEQVVRLHVIEHGLEQRV